MPGPGRGPQRGFWAVSGRNQRPDRRVSWVQHRWQRRPHRGLRRWGRREARFGLQPGSSSSCRVGALASPMLGLTLLCLLVATAGSSELLATTMRAAGGAAVAGTPIAGGADQGHRATESTAEDPVGAGHGGASARGIPGPGGARVCRQGELRRIQGEPTSCQPSTNDPTKRFLMSLVPGVLSLTKQDLDASSRNH